MYADELRSDPWRRNLPAGVPLRLLSGQSPAWSNCVTPRCPASFRAIAVHYWFVVFDLNSRRWHRWEVWQTKNAGGQSVGHIHCDLRHPDCGVGGGAYRLAAEWDGSAAQADLCRSSEGTAIIRTGIVIAPGPAQTVIPLSRGYYERPVYTTPSIHGRSVRTTWAYLGCGVLPDRLAHSWKHLCSESGSACMIAWRCICSV